MAKSEVEALAREEEALARKEKALTAIQKDRGEKALTEGERKETIGRETVDRKKGEEETAEESLLTATNEIIELYEELSLTRYQEYNLFHTFLAGGGACSDREVLAFWPNTIRKEQT